MMNRLFIQFYSEIDGIVDISNGFSDTYDYCKNMGDIVWVDHTSKTTELPINSGEVYISAVYTSHLLEAISWAEKYENIKFIVGGPLLISDFLVQKEPLPFNLEIVKCSVEEFFGIPNFSRQWNLVVPKELENKVIHYCYTLDRDCYWNKCIFCPYKNQTIKHRFRKELGFEFKNVDHKNMIVRIGSDSLTPKTITSVIPNLPISDKLKKYRVFMRATDGNVKALKECLTEGFPIKFGLGIEFPVDRMLQFMKKGCTTSEIFNMLNLLQEKKAEACLNFISGWSNLISEDLIHLEDFMKNIPKYDGFSFLISKLTVFHNSILYELYEKGEEIKSGPFSLGFYPKLDKEQQKLDEEAKNIMLHYLGIKYKKLITSTI
jgi:hypothetical protein